MLPVEMTCYASEEEISRAIKPLIAQYFPTETQTPQKVRLYYEYYTSYILKCFHLGFIIYTT